MSGVYALEPPTAGKVVLKTSVGDLDVELWAKEAPRAARNFVQLCLEGYYDRTVFHRIVKDFLVQGGDPTGTGQGGESVYGAPFEDEFHSRLQFRRRGMVACANANEPNTNGSQFFVTLDRSDWLNKKHTIFGTVTGDTVYNLMRLSEYDVDEHDRPKDPPQILGTEVLWNLFDDIVPRRLERPPPPEEKAKKKKLKAKELLGLHGPGAGNWRMDGGTLAEGCPPPPFVPARTTCTSERRRSIPSTCRQSPHQALA